MDSLQSRGELDLGTQSGASASSWALNELEIPRSPRYGHSSQLSGSSNDTDSLPPPRPAYSRPVSYGMPSPTHSTDKLLYYGRVTPSRPGARDSTATSLRPRDSVATSLMYGTETPTPGSPTIQTPNQSVADLHHQSQSLDDLRMVLGDVKGPPSFTPSLRT